MTTKQQQEYEREEARIVVGWLTKLYGDPLGAKQNDSAYKTDVVALCQRIYLAFKSGTLKLALGSDLVLKVKNWEFYGSNPYDQDCYECRGYIARGGPIWFQRTRNGQRAVALHERCYQDIVVGGQGQLFESLDRDGLVPAPLKPQSPPRRRKRT